MARLLEVWHLKVWLDTNTAKLFLEITLYFCYNEETKTVVFLIAVVVILTVSGFYFI